LQDMMNPSRRIILNTIATYSRSVFSVFLALFSSRWVLNALGQSDFGLYSLVSAIVILIVFLNSVMATSVARFFAYSIGQGDPGEVKSWFNVAFSIHLCFAVILGLIGWVLGDSVITHVLNIPIDRMSICLFVFRISLITAFFCMISVPYVAMFQAKQRISELAFWGLLQTFLSFSLAYLLRNASGDRLLFYAVGMGSIILFNNLIQIIRAMVVFPECKINLRQWFNIKKAKRVFSFAVWYLIGSLGSVGRNQGSAILLNVYFGPIANAAYGIANQVSTQVNQLSAAMIGAFSPEIIATEGRGDRSGMLLMSMRASKFGTILVLFFAIPLMVEMENVLRLWLRTPPPGTATFCRWILATYLIDRLSTGYMLAVSAHGKIAAYQATVGVSLVLTLPLAWIFLKLGFAPTSIGIAFVVGITVCSFGRVFWGRYLFGVSIKRWFLEVVLPSSLVAFSGGLAAWIPTWILPPSLLRFALSASASISVALITAYKFGLDDAERGLAKRIISRLHGRMARIDGF